MFYTHNALYDSSDFYSGDTSSPIKITVSFCDLTQEETSFFSKYVENNQLVIEKEMEWPRGGRSLYFRDPAGNSVELITPGLWGLRSGW